MFHNRLETSVYSYESTSGKKNAPSLSKMTITLSLQKQFITQAKAKKTQEVRVLIIGLYYTIIAIFKWFKPGWSKLFYFVGTLHATTWSKNWCAKTTQETN